jgi:cell division septal protein FtsQ
MALAAPADPILLARRRAVSRARGRRRLALLACVAGVGAAIAGYQVLKASSVFAVRSIVVEGGTASLNAQVKAVMAGAVSGRSLLEVSTSPLQRELLRMPDVRTARVDRAFPNTLRVTLVPERPAVIAVAGRSAYAVASDGRVLGPADPSRSRLPEVSLATHGMPAAGSSTQDANLRAALAALASTPAWFDRRVGRITRLVPRTGSLTLVVGHGLVLRLGSIGPLDLKLQVAARVLGVMPRRDRRSLAYVDVSAPGHPALGYRK